MNNQLMELDTPGLQAINGGIAWGLTIWGIAAVVIANWAELKQGIADGWEDQQHPNPYRP